MPVCILLLIALQISVYELDMNAHCSPIVTLDGLLPLKRDSTIKYSSVESYTMVL